MPPRLVTTGPVFENVLRGDQIDVFRFPTPKWHAGDGGRYIGTECVIISKDPDSDWVNIGTYRVMVSDARTLTVFIEPGKQGDVIRRKYWARGLPCPMAISVGQAPILGVMAATAVRAGISEYAAAGARIGRPIDVVSGKVTGLPIPADAELVFEGFMPPPSVEARHEGPFGEWPGYYASEGPQPVLKVEAVYHRNDAIVIGQPPTTPNYPGRQVKMASLAALWDALEAAGVPEVHGVWNLQGGGYRFIQVDLDQAAACRPRQDGGSGRGRVGRLLHDAHGRRRRRRHRHHQCVGGDVGDGDALGPQDPDRHHRRLLDRLHRSAAAAGEAQERRYHAQPDHHLRGASVRMEGQFPVANTIERDYADVVRKKWGEHLPFLDRGPAVRMRAAPS